MIAAQTKASCKLLRFDQLTFSKIRSRLRIRPPSRAMQSIDAPPTLLKYNVDGHELVHFGMNDYLGLAKDRRVVTAVADTMTACGWGAAASSAHSGRVTTHVKLEQRLAAFVGADAVRLLSSGYSANLDAIRTLVSQGDAIYCDEENHHSLLDAAQLSGAVVHVYRHSNCSDLESLLKSSSRFRRRVIVSETLFGCDGSLAPLDELDGLATRYQAQLMLDESHAIGILGVGGSGAAAFLEGRGTLGARTGTLGKALGGIGGFIAGSRYLIESVHNNAPCFRHSTALPAAICAGAIAALDVISAEPHRAQTLNTQAAEVRTRLQKQGWNIGAAAGHVIPIWFEEARRAETVAASLASDGFHVPCMRAIQNAVTKRILRLRINYWHEPHMIEGLLASFARGS